VRKEVARYSSVDLSGKREVVVLTKADTRDPVFIEEVSARMRLHGAPVYTVSVLDDAAVKALGDRLVDLLRKA
jgi:ethanolamine utilization protein EutP (predicted NTPase)